MSQRERMTLFVVLTPGDRGIRVAEAAQQQADHDPEHRYVVKPGDAMYPAPAVITAWDVGAAAALILDESGSLREVLDEQKATSGAWIEDAFLRASK
jgi:hypothetical protein